PLFAIAFLVLVWCIWAIDLLLGRADAAASALSSLVVAVVAVALDQAVFGALHAGLAPGVPAPQARTAESQRLLRAVRLVVRALAAALAVLFLADAFGLGLGAWLETPDGRTAARAGLNIAVTLALALLVWHGVRHFIDRQLAKAEQARPTEGAAAQFGTRAETLLPLLRNFVLVVLLVMVTMIVLSSLGIDIGPLIAGAGIVGLAIGFGSQTLVKDIVAGVFFLIDDAFRVGEYVETGDKRGTVEAISLRSLRLRHHRGPLHTIPFGELQAVTNYSRGWVIEKLELNVTYDTDLDKVKRIIKQVSREISEEPEFKRVLLEPPKSQGVDRLADFSMVVRIKFKALPGEQFVLRRELYKRLKRAFDANGISFALPTVTVRQTGAPATPAEVPAEVADAAAAAGRRGGEGRAPGG
ncbi:MAG: mechanosensitive ion channel family protein, partial [Rhodospirillaceae bacterium]|nr:mechanosensitive ion channel family protein [Rhodospirillaceae bacterium]